LFYTAITNDKRVAYLLLDYVMYLSCAYLNDFYQVETVKHCRLLETKYRIMLLPILVE